MLSRRRNTYIIKGHSDHPHMEALSWIFCYLHPWARVSTAPGWKAKVSAAAASSAAVLGRLAVWCGQHRKHRHLPIIPPTFPRITNKQETTLLPGIQLHSSTGGLYSKPFSKSLGGFYELLAGTTTMSILKELDLTRNSRRYSAEQRKGWRHSDEYRHEESALIHAPAFDSF